MSTLSPQDIKILEQTRQRLSQLTNSLLSLQQQILTSDPLPPWSSLHTASLIIAQNLTTLTSLLNTHAPLLSSLIAYPLPTFPGREQPSILHALLRKKLEPVVEEWVEEGRVEGVRAVAGEGDGDGGGGEDGVGRGVLELWGWAGMAANVEARRHDWEGAEFTREEREGVGGWEGVVTGLRGRMGDGEGEGESEDGDGDGDPGEGKGEEVDRVVPPMKMEDVLRFMARGEEVKT